jgi:hypothetical protein
VELIQQSFGQEKDGINKILENSYKRQINGTLDIIFGYCLKKIRRREVENNFSSKLTLGENFCVFFYRCNAFSQHVKIKLV